MAWTLVQSASDDAADPAFSATPTAGNVLLAVGAERSGAGTSGTITGWAQLDTINHKPADTSYRMSSTVWAKESDGTEGTVTFPAGNVYRVIAELAPGVGDNAADLLNALIDSAALDFVDNGNVNVGSVTTPALNPASNQYLKLGICVVKENELEAGGAHDPITFDENLTTEVGVNFATASAMTVAVGLHTDTESVSQDLTATLTLPTERGAMAFYLLVPSPQDQFLFPTADQAAGLWTTAPLFSDVDDDSRVNPTGDGAVITSDAVGNNTATSNADLQLGAANDPQSSTDHVLRVRWNHDDPARSMQGHVELWQGIPGTGTMVAELLSAVDVGATEVEDTYTLTAVEADSITDYADLYLRIFGFGTGGGPSRSLVVDLVEFQVPPAAAGGETALYGRVTETETARSVASSKETSVGRVTETETNRAFISAKDSVFGRATEIETASAFRAAITRKLHCRDTQAGPGTGGDVYDLNTDQGSPTASVTGSTASPNDTFQEVLRFQADVGDSVQSTEFATSVNIVSWGIPVGGSGEGRWRVQRLNSNNEVQASSNYSQLVTDANTGVQTASLTLDTGWLNGDRLALSFEARRASGLAGSVTVEIATQDADSAVTAAFFDPPDTFAPLGRTIESEIARELVASKSDAFGRVTETESARAFILQTGIIYGRVTEAEVARSTTASKTSQFGRTTETEAVRAFEPTRSFDLGRVTEVEVARAFGFQTSFSYGHAAESEIARGFAVAKTTDFGRVIELESARGLTGIREYDYIRLTESEAVRGFAIIKSQSIGRVTEAESERNFILGLIAPPPPERSLVVPAEPRSVAVLAEFRVVTEPIESRKLVIP